MKTYLERARIARAVKVRVMDELGIVGTIGRSLSPIRGKSRNETKKGFDGNARDRKSPAPGPQFLGKRLEPAT